MFMAGSRINITTLTLVVITLLYSLGSCNNDPTCSHQGEMPQIYWQDVNSRMKQAIDVGDEANISDAQLSTKYTTNHVEAIVRRPTVNGNRYLLLKQRSARRQWIILPGTNIDNIQSVLADLDSTPIMDTELGAEFHRGFHTLAESVRVDVEPLLDPRYSTHITGYSLGGAMAAILSLQLNLHGFDVESVVTFGQPKVTFAAGARAFADRPLLRFIAGRDGIPILYTDPAYTHFGQEIILLDGPNLVFLGPGDVNYDFSTSSSGEAPNSILNIKDHGTYLARLASKLDAKINTVSFCSLAQFIVSL